MRKETKKFMSYNDLFCKTLYKQQQELNVQELEYNNYLLDNEQIKEKMLELMNTEGEHFIYSQTGSGKTYSIVDCFRTLSEVEQNPTFEDVMTWVETLDNERLKNDCRECETLAKDLYCIREAKMFSNILMVPARSQTLQAAEEYNLEAVVGNDENNRLDLFKSQNIVSVYDKAAEIYEVIDKCTDIKCRLIIDESHLLCMAKYRSKAIEELEKLKELVLLKGGSVIYLTASYMAMVYLKDLKNVLFCNKKNIERNFKELNLYVNTKDRKIQDFTFDVLQDKKGLVRYNNKETQKALKNKLEEDNKTVCYINSDEKDSITDKETNKTTYKNKMLDSVINNSQLPEIDFGFATSLLDAGTNIKGVNGIQDPNFNPFYVIDTSTNLNMLNIEQFSNRLRFKVNSYNILINNVVSDKDYNLSLEDIIKFQAEKLEKQLKFLKGEEELLRELYAGKENLEEAIERAMLNTLECENNFDNLKNSYGGSITYSKKTGFKVEYKYFLNYCLERYYLTLYYNRDLFINELQELFNVKVNVIENTESSGENVSETYKIKYKEELLDYYLQHQELPDWTTLDIKKLIKRYMTATNTDLNEAIIEVLSNSELVIDKKLNEKCQSVLKSISKAEKSILKDVLRGDKQVKDINNEKVRRNVGIIVDNKKVKEKLQKTLKKGLELDEVLEHYDINNDKSLNTYVKEKQVIQNNKNYLLDERLLYDHASYDQYVVLDFIKNVKNYQIFEKRKTDKEDKIDELMKILKDKTGHEYTRRKLINFIKSIYNYREIEEKTGKKVIKVIYLNSIKTKM